MSLLDQILSIDLSSITDARTLISDVLQSEAVQGLVGNGALQSVLSELGGGIATLQTDFSDPGALLQPLVERVASLGGSFSSSDLPLADYLRAVSDGAAIIAGLLDGLDDDPIKLGRIFGLMPQGILSQAQSVFQGYTSIDLSSVGRYKNLVTSVERGIPADPAAFANLALDILLPMPRSHLQEIRSILDTIAVQCESITLPSTRTAGLLSALEAVTAAARSGNSLQLNAALSALQIARTSTVLSVSTDLERIVSAIESVPFEQLARPLEAAGAVLGRAEQGIMEFFATLDGALDRAQQTIDELTPQQVTDQLEALNVLIENALRTYIREPIEAQVRRAEAWMRGLLAQVPLASYRALVTDFILSIARAVDEADLDRPARELRGLLDTIERGIDPSVMTDRVEATLETLQDTLGNAIDQISAALGVVRDGVNAASGAVVGVLEQLSEALEGFREVIGQVTDAIDGLGIEAAVDMVVDAIVQLRQTAETLLGGVALPEPLRPAVEQLAIAIENIDLDEVLAPVRSAAQRLQIPASVGGTVTQGLEKAAEVLENLIPDNLISQLQEQIADFCAQLEQLDPATLLSGLDDYVNEARTFIQGLDPRPAVESIRAPFQQVLDTFDRLHPARLLEPVAQAYDSLLSHITIPSADNVTRAAATALNGAGESLTSGIANAVDQATGAAVSATLQPPTPVAQGGAPQTEPPQLRYKPGDVLRMLGYLPRRLREALAELNAGAAGEVLESIDSMVSRLAADLRGLQATLQTVQARIETQTQALLAPLARAQLDAQLAIQVNMAEGQFDVQGALTIVAQAGPARLRADLQPVRARVGVSVDSRSAAALGSLGGQLGRAADALERCSLCRLGGSLDNLLAALDVEPLAQRLDSVVVAAIQKAASLLGNLDEVLQQFYNRLCQSLSQFNPTTLAQQFLGIIDLLKEQLDLLDPRRLAAELGQIHAAVREVIAAYDPAIFAQEIWEILERISDGLAALSPSSLLAGLSISDDFAQRIEELLPLQALEGIDRSLDGVGAQLRAIDPAALLESVNNLAPRVVGQFGDGLERVKNEIVTLLRAVRFAAGSASASASASIG